MPMDKSKYPPNWDEISHRIRFERAGGQCEQCGAPNGVQILRSIDNPERFIIFDEVNMVYTKPNGDWIKATEVPSAFHIELMPYTRVVLTVHHIGVPKPDGSPGSPHDKMDCRDENLIALCQRCHLLADQHNNIIARKRTLLNKKATAKRDAGQMELFE